MTQQNEFNPRLMFEENAFPGSFFSEDEYRDVWGEEWHALFYADPALCSKKA